MVALSRCLASFAFVLLGAKGVRKPDGDIAQVADFGNYHLAAQDSTYDGEVQLISDQKQSEGFTKDDIEPIDSTEPCSSIQCEDPNESECQEAATTLGKVWGGSKLTKRKPTGCYDEGAKIKFNGKAGGRTNTNTTWVCLCTASPPEPGPTTSAPPSPPEPGPTTSAPKPAPTMPINCTEADTNSTMWEAGTNFSACLEIAYKVTGDEGNEGKANKCTCAYKQFVWSYSKAAVDECDGDIKAHFEVYFKNGFFEDYFGVENPLCAQPS